MSDGDDRPRPRLSGRRERWTGREPAGGEASRRTSSGREEEEAAAADRGADAAGESREPPPGTVSDEGDGGPADVPAGDGPR